MEQRIIDALETQGKDIAQIKTILFNQFGLTRTGKKKKNTDPDQPKKPNTAYQFFLKEQTSKAKAAGKTIQFAEVGKLWGELSDAEKAPFEAQAIEHKKLYEVAKSAYEATKKTKTVDDAADTGAGASEPAGVSEIAVSAADPDVTTEKKRRPRKKTETPKAVAVTNGTHSSEEGKTEEPVHVAPATNGKAKTTPVVTEVEAPAAKTVGRPAKAKRATKKVAGGDDAANTRAPPVALHDDGSSQE